MSDFLFDRTISITARIATSGTSLRIASANVAGDKKNNLRIVFDVKKTLEKDPNTASIEIYNLAPQHRRDLQQRDMPVEIVAGYVGLNNQQLFSGTTEVVTNNRDDISWVTRLMVGDGSEEIRRRQVGFSQTSVGGRNYKAGSASLRTVAKDLATDLGLSGNLETALDGIKDIADITINKGMALSGPAAKSFDIIMRRLGMTWSIQNGELRVLKPTAVIKGPDIVPNFGPNSGLVGSPEFGEDGYIRFRVLLRPELIPGQEIVLTDVAGVAPGILRCVRVSHRGDTWGQDWYSDVEAQIFKG